MTSGLRRWLPGAGALIVVLVTGRLGYWQLDRAHQKEALQAQYQRMIAAPPLDLSFAQGDIAGERYRRAQAKGVLEYDHEVLLDNQVHEAHAGYHVLTPMRMENGQRVMVNRGWLARSQEYPSIPNVPHNLQAGTIYGILDRGDRALIELSSETIQGKVWQNFTTQRFRDKTGFAVLPVILVQQEGVQSPFVRVNPIPEFGIVRHYGYAVQWFGLAFTAFILYVIYHFRSYRQAPAR